MSEFPKTDLNRINRKPARGQYDRDTIYPILAEALICYVGFVDDGQPVVIPTLHARVGDTLYLHGAPASRMLKILESGEPVCVTTALVDGIVFARSVFSHSINYRSVVLFGRGRPVETDEEKLCALEAITEQVSRGRWADARRPTQKELDATRVVAVEIESASAKVRSGPPADEAEDYELPVWAGVLPLSLQAGLPIPDDRLQDGVQTPDYVADYRRE
jgi:nitroimidazol reductase NimA-like FMN-containing flavoprotein (pyridoxamine 5'-phosphate oxidase superfamily)